MMITTVTLLRYVGAGGRYRAFANMGRWLLRPFRAEGLRFQKMMGSGQNFGLVPDLSTYVFLGVWQDEASARRFFATDAWQKATDGVRQTGTLWLEPTTAQGRWDGQNPFGGAGQVPNRTADEGQRGPVAVLTRATIRTGALLDFWRNVPQARRRLTDHKDDLLLALGVGEKPVVQQCTISVWRDASAVNQFAYRQSGHREIVKMTRQRQWYSEELFARFRVLAAEGELVQDVANRLITRPLTQF